MIDLTIYMRYSYNMHCICHEPKDLCEALGFLKLLKLDDEVLSANIEASARRHLLRHGRVTLIPGPQHVLRYAPALLAELLWPRGREADESVEAFVVRRGSRGLAALAAALCRGQLAGDSRELSAPGRELKGDHTSLC